MCIRDRYYIDEFHLLLKEEQTATYSIEIWKRFRKWGGIPTGITPFSYTHLDVYKRQSRDNHAARAAHRPACSHAPHGSCGDDERGSVSYTHLDVYKRQALPRN